MEYSFVFLGERDRKKVLEKLSFKLKLANTVYQVIFLTNKPPKKELLSNINKYLNFKTIVFESFATNDEMVENFMSSEGVGTVILFKETAVNINFNDINKMIEQHTRGSMLVVSKQNKTENIIQKSFNVIKNFFTRIFLGVKLFNGNADIVLIDKILTSTMAEMPGKSATLTKLNGWAGVEPKYVNIDEQPKSKCIKASIKDLSSVILLATILLLSIIGNILFSVLNVKLPFLLLFFYIVVQVAVLALLLYSLTKSLFKIKFGNVKHIRKANILEEIDNFDD